ncbi:MAG: hypothetical protein GVY19_06900 [Bacteroidetes bacterium]|jgi:carbamoyltransferase|nr:hypothetical protein [Bacteroidota bacterium]
MTASEVTIGIYGIHDIATENYPVYVHDHSLVLFSQGELQKYLHLERLTRLKYDHRMPYKIYDIMQSAGLLNTESDIVFVDNTIGRAFISGHGNIRFEVDNSRLLQNDLEEGIVYWLDKHKTGYILNHELAHIYSMVPFCGWFIDNSLLIHFDGGASKGNYSVWLYRNGKISLIKYGWELHYLSALFNANAFIFGLTGDSRKTQNSVPGKFMGYAAYGTPDPKLEKWLIGHHFFTDTWKSKEPFYRAAKNELGIDIQHTDLHNPFIKDLAATIQHYFTQQFLQFIELLQNDIQADYLYYAGGSALSIVTNTSLTHSGLFAEVNIPPCPNDAGLSIGAAVAAEIRKGHTIKQVSPYCNNWGIEDYRIQYDKHTIHETAELLLQHKVIGICNGFAEAGPRALGNRSIIALANNKQLAKKVSITHKKREWYRPLAPMMLLKNLPFFSADMAKHHLSRFMLINYSIKKETYNEIEGGVHVDGSARIQTLEKNNENPFLFDLLEYLEYNHDIKAILNTSFNQKGEPIVHTIEDAYKAAINMKLDAVIVNGRLVMFT